MLGPGDFTAGHLGSFHAVAFGCPAMGSEVLEEREFEPMFTAPENSLSGKNIALFGSYGWGDGQWIPGKEGHILPQPWADRYPHGKRHRRGRSARGYYRNGLRGQRGVQVAL